MKNSDQWIPTKFIYINKKLKANRDPKFVWICSRLFCDLIAELYDKNIKQYCHGDIVDLGCGNVPLYNVYKDITTSQTCVDWSNTLHKNLFLDKEVDLNDLLPFPDESFDSAILSDVLEHIRKPQELINEVHRVLRNKGVFILGVPFHYLIHETPYDYFRYTEYSLKMMADESKFEIVSLEPIGGGIDVWGDLTSKLLYRIPFIGKLLAIVLQWGIYNFGKTKLGKKIRTVTSKTDPMGYVAVLIKKI